MSNESHEDDAASIEALKAQLAALEAILQQLAKELDKHRFAERFRRWKERAALAIEEGVDRREAERFRRLPDGMVGYDQHRESEVVPHRDFIQILAEEIEQHRRMSNTLTVRTKTKRLTAAPRHLFLSHSADDAALAEFVREQLMTALPQLKVFMASLPGQIPVGDDWLQVIKRELRSADSYLVLLTPHSVQRPWIHFETGAAWMSDKPMLTVAAGELAKEDVPLPLSSFHILSLEHELQAIEVFRQLHSELDNPSAFTSRTRELSR
jgi:hypothetical protein